MDYEILSAKTLLKNRGVSVLDAARLVCGMLDLRAQNSPLSPLQFCAKLVEAGKAHLRTQEMTLERGFALYLTEKAHLRPESRRDFELGREVWTRGIAADYGRLWALFRGKIF